MVAREDFQLDGPDLSRSGMQVPLESICHSPDQAAVEEVDQGGPTLWARSESGQISIPFSIGEADIGWSSPHDPDLAGVIPSQRLPISCWPEHSSPSSRSDSVQP